MKIEFFGAAHEVTGSKHLLTTRKGKRILLDCGLFQGKGLETDQKNRTIPFDPKSIDHIILSHAHIDHSGLIPYMWKKGFEGSIVCTSATRDLCAVMLADSAHIQEQDVLFFNKKRSRQGLPPVEPLYRRSDAVACMQAFIGVPYGRKFYIDPEITIKFTHTGHMLGGGVVNLTIKENGSSVRIAYTGDIGRPHPHVIKEPEPFPQCDVLITESTYGDRLHSDPEQAGDDLLKVIRHTCVEKGGKLVIPSFSVGRTQEIVYSLNKFSQTGRLPPVDVFVDSPLSVNATQVFRLHPECFSSEVLKVMETDPDPFGFNSLRYIEKVQDSMKLNTRKEPCIIISASGMAEAGPSSTIWLNRSSDQETVLLSDTVPGTMGAVSSGKKDIFDPRNPIPSRQTFGDRLLQRSWRLQEWLNSSPVRIPNKSRRPLWFTGIRTPRMPIRNIWEIAGSTTLPSRLLAKTSPGNQEQYSPPGPNCSFRIRIPVHYQCPVGHHRQKRQ